jgi:hypothetical protein
MLFIGIGIAVAGIAIAIGQIVSTIISSDTAERMSENR